DRAAAHYPLATGVTTGPTPGDGAAVDTISNHRARTCRPGHEKRRRSAFFRFAARQSAARIDFQQFDFEHQRGIRADLLAGAVLAVAHFRRDHDAPLVTDAHQLQRFLPALDHLAQREAGRLATLHGAVEHS